MFLRVGKKVKFTTQFLKEAGHGDINYEANKKLRDLKGVVTDSHLWRDVTYYTVDWGNAAPDKSVVSELYLQPTT